MVFRSNERQISLPLRVFSEKRSPAEIRWKAALAGK